jgi:GTPase SAR1 family protein
MHDIAREHPGLPSLLLLNKCDLESEWEVHEDNLKPFDEAGVKSLSTSAKTGAHIEDAFETLAQLMIEGPSQT